MQLLAGKRPLGTLDLPRARHHLSDDVLELNHVQERNAVITIHLMGRSCPSYKNLSSGQLRVPVRRITRQ